MKGWYCAASKRGCRLKCGAPDWARPATGPCGRSGKAGEAIGVVEAMDDDGGNRPLRLGGGGSGVKGGDKGIACG